MKRAIVTAGMALALLTSSLFLSAPSVRAADQEESENITLSPAVNRPTLDAGQRLSDKITVINNGTSDYTFLVYARPFSVAGEQYDPNYTEINEKTQAYQWVEFSQAEYHLAAGQRVDVPYTVSVPQNAASGGHYAVLFAETQPPEGASGSSVMRKKRVGSLLYMTVNGEITMKGSLESWDVKTWQTSRPITSTVRIKNSGNTHFQTDMKVHYSSLLGKKRYELNQQLLILPGTTRRVPVEWANAPNFGVFKASGTVSYLDKNESLPVRYIILLPIPLLLGALVAILLLVTFAIYKRRISRRTTLV